MGRFSSLSEVIRRKLDVTPARAQAIVDCAQFNIIVDDISAGGEQNLSTGRPCVGFNNQAGVAAQLGHIQLFNPAGSGVIVVIDRMYPSLGGVTNDQYGLRIHDTALGTLTAFKSFADRREPGLPAAELRATTNAVAQGTLIGAARMRTAEMKQITPPRGLLLIPGQGVLWVRGIVNETADCAWYWREITASTQQLTL